MTGNVGWGFFVLVLVRRSRPKHAKRQAFARGSRGSGVLDGLGDLLEGGGAVVEELEAPEAEAAVAGLDRGELREADAEAWAPGGVFVGPDDLANRVNAAFLRDGVKDFKDGGGEVIKTTDDFLTHGPRCGFHKWTCQEWLRWLN